MGELIYFTASIKCMCIRYRQTKIKKPIPVLVRMTSQSLPARKCQIVKLSSDVTHLHCFIRKI